MSPNPSGIIFFTLNFLGFFTTWIPLYANFFSPNARFSTEGKLGFQSLILPIMFGVACSMLNLSWCLGMVWEMKPERFPEGFCKWQGIMISWSAYQLACCVSCLGMTTWMNIKNPTSGRNPVAIRKRLIPVLFGHPLIGLIVFSSVSLTKKAFRPSFVICDAIDPPWVRMLSYAGWDWLVFIPGVTACFLAYHRLIMIDRRIAAQSHPALPPSSLGLGVSNSPPFEPAVKSSRKRHSDGGVLPRIDINGTGRVSGTDELDMRIGFGSDVMGRRGERLHRERSESLASYSGKGGSKHYEVYHDESVSTASFGLSSFSHDRSGVSSSHSGAALVSFTSSEAPRSPNANQKKFRGLSQHILEINGLDSLVWGGRSFTVNNPGGMNVIKEDDGEEDTGLKSGSSGGSDRGRKGVDRQPSSQTLSPPATSPPLEPIPSLKAYFSAHSQNPPNTFHHSPTSSIKSPISSLVPNKTRAVSGHSTLSSRPSRRILILVIVYCMVQAAASISPILSVAQNSTASRFGSEHVASFLAGFSPLLVFVANPAFQDWWWRFEDRVGELWTNLTEWFGSFGRRRSRDSVAEDDNDPRFTSSSSTQVEMLDC